MIDLRARITYILKHNIWINRIFNIVMSTCIRTLGLFIKTDSNSIFFCGQKGKYSDSVKTIYEYMIAHPKYSKLRYVWAVDRKYQYQIAGSCKKVSPDTFSYFVETLRCKYWVASVNIERSLRYKKKSTVYLNTWHGTPIKTIGNAAKGRKDYDFSYIDYFCSAGEYETDIYIRDFNVRPESIIPTGLARNDELYSLQSSDIAALRSKLNIPNNKQVILYAPTWRDSNDNGKTYGIKPPIDFNKWEERLGDKYVVLLRVHPYTTNLLGVHFNSFVRDVSDYPEINDLLRVSDILISDYSATIFDYSILCKPIVCFAYDYETYKQDRGLYVDLNSTIPGGVMLTEDDVIARVLAMNYIEECQITKCFKEKYLQYGGNATQSCVDALMIDYGSLD